MIVFARELAKFDRYQGEQIKLVQTSEDLPIDKMRIDSPFNARVSYSIYSALVILPRHQRRHIVQAESVWPR